MQYDLLFATKVQLAAVFVLCLILLSVKFGARIPKRARSFHKSLYSEVFEALNKHLG